jgi:hypothetical protein
MHGPGPEQTGQVEGFESGCLLLFEPYRVLGLLVENWCASGVKEPDTAPVDVTAALQVRHDLSVQSAVVIAEPPAWRVPAGGQIRASIPERQPTSGTQQRPARPRRAASITMVVLPASLTLGPGR